MVIEILLLLPSALLTWMYVGYPLTLWLLSRISRDQTLRSPIEPNVSVVICTHNEAAVIDRRIKNVLEQDYPRQKLEIVVVDSSTDPTADLIQKHWKKDVTLLKQEVRRGKANAINLALEKASGEVILLSDAPTLYDKDAIKNIVRNFADSRVGGATGKYKPIGEEKRVEHEESLFWRFKNALRSLEGTVDSTTFFSGDLCAFRKALITEIDNDTLADDVNIAIRIRRKGYKAIYDPSAKVFELATSSYKDLFTAKVRRAIGGIQETLRFKNMIFNPRFGVYGMLILPTRFMYTILNPFIILAFSATLAYLAFHLFPFLSLLLLLCVFAAILLFWRSTAVKALTMFWVTQIIQLQALVKYLFGKPSVEWTQIDSTRKNAKIAGSAAM